MNLNVMEVPGQEAPADVSLRLRGDFADYAIAWGAIGTRGDPPIDDLRWAGSVRKHRRRDLNHKGTKLTRFLESSFVPLW